MKDKKISNKIFWFTFLVLLMSFTTIYISARAGYYEYTQSKRKTLTEEQIKKFEEDIKSGKNLNLEDYMVLNENFQDKKQRIGSKISEVIGKTTKTGVTNLFKTLEKLIEE